MGVKLKLTGYILVALIAILTYFHLECIKERNERSSMFDEFNPEVTDCHNVPLPFRYLLMSKLIDDILKATIALSNVSILFRTSFMVKIVL